MDSLTLKSGAFEHRDIIPRKYGYKNGNHSPPLDIAGVPSNAKSLVIIMDDPDAMGAVGKVWTHWVLWNIDPTSTIREDSVPSDCLAGLTDFGETGYGGPAPPDKEHTYVFKLYALDQRLDAKSGSTKQEIESTMSGHVIAEARLEGRYSPQV
ncbi:MAG: YbhB/YbcL family Raf kinase inhibitor-like protein [Nitrosopumilus sp. B06]|nr:MAG: YbhB/YbcL family Raf kinase inhibitor-like protein [Nitrosopumilus sp. B06]